MLSVFVSTLALALVLGPQLQVNLPAALDETPAIERQVEQAEDVAPPADADTADAAEEATALPLEQIEETVIEDNQIATPALPDPDTIEDEVAPALTATNGEVPASEWPAILSAASAALAAADGHGGAVAGGGGAHELPELGGDDGVEEALVCGAPGGVGDEGEGARAQEEGADGEAGAAVVELRHDDAGDVLEEAGVAQDVDGVGWQREGTWE